MEQQKTSISVKDRVCEPRRFIVVIHNDDFTPMEFVVMILSTIFFKSPAEAERLMLDVHNNGSGIAGIYPYDIAETKRRKAVNLARKEGYPLRLTLQPAD